MSKIVYVDMDDTIADFTGAILEKHGVYNEYAVRSMYEPGFFYGLRPIPGSLSGVRGLIRLGYDVHILSKPLATSSHSYSEKVQWISLHFPDLIRKVHFTQDKGLFKGDYLIDDNPAEWKEKFEANGGKFVTFHHRETNYWDEILRKFEGWVNG